MVKNDEEINSLGKLVVSMTKEILDTNRKVLDLEKRVSAQEKRSLEVEANHKIQELEKRITELEKKRLEPAEGKTQNESIVLVLRRSYAACFVYTSICSTFRYSQI